MKPVTVNEKSKDFCGAAPEPVFVTNINLSNFTDLEADRNLFCKVVYHLEHVLHHLGYSRQFQLLPTAIPLGHAPSTENSPDRLPHLLDCSFITRMLFYQSLTLTHTYVLSFVNCVFYIIPVYYFSCWVDFFGSVPYMCCEQAFTLFGYRKRRKDKDVTSSPGGSGSPTGVNAEVDSRPYLDDDFTQERIIDVDLLPLVLPPYGVDYNEWLATHSTSTDICVELDLKTSGQRILSKGRVAGRRIESSGSWSSQLFRGLPCGRKNSTGNSMVWNQRASSTTRKYRSRTKSRDR